MKRSLTEMSGIDPAISIMFLLPASSVSVSRILFVCRCIESCISCLISMRLFWNPKHFLVCPNVQGRSLQRWLEEVCGGAGETVSVAR